MQGADRPDPGPDGDRAPADRGGSPIAIFPGGEGEARRRLCRVGRDLHESALIGGRAGNLSVRLDPRRLLVTPRGANQGHLDPGELVVVPVEEASQARAGTGAGGAGGDGAPPANARDESATDDGLRDRAPPGAAAGDAGGGASGADDAPADGADGPEARATSELPFHRAVYRARADVAAAVHTHAPALTAAGLRGLDVTAPFPEIEEALGAVGRVPFRPSGSRALADAVAAAAERADVLLLERHGTLALGVTPEEARDRTELAELTAWAALLAEDAGLGLDLRRVAALHRRIVGRAKGG